MGDPNYEHNGETMLAWHFSTDQGEFLMMEDDEEAFMLNPRDPGNRRGCGVRRGC